MINEKLDLVIQGKYDSYVSGLIDHYSKLPFINKIIISDFENGEIPKLNKVIHVTCPIPEDPGTGNRNLQIATSYNGLKAVTTNYAIKIRSDQKYSLICMENMYKFFIENKERELTFYEDSSKPKNSIITGGLFSPFTFHPRDHIFFGHIEDLLDLFNIPYETPNFTKVYGIAKEYESWHYDKHIRTESYIGTHYCSNFNKKLKHFLKYPKVYLHDGSIKRDWAMKISNEISHKIFKPVPSKFLDLEWPKYGWEEYRVDSQRDIFGERWAEDFV